VNRKGVNRTDAGAGAALKTLAFIATDLAGQSFDLDPEVLEIGQGLFDVLSAALELNDHDTLSLGQDVSLQDIELDIKARNQVVDYGLVASLYGKT
jgi:hypothetical protein